MNQGIFIFCPARAKCRRALIAYREIPPKNREPTSTYRADFFVTFVAFCSTSRLFAHRPRLIALNRGCSRLFALVRAYNRDSCAIFWGAWSRFLQSGLAIHPSIYRGIPPNRFPQTNFRLNQTCSDLLRLKNNFPAPRRRPNPPCVPSYSDLFRVEKLFGEVPGRPIFLIFIFLTTAAVGEVQLHCNSGAITCTFGHMVAPTCTKLR